MRDIPALEPDEIVAQYKLPDSDRVIESLKISPSQLSDNVANRDDLTRTGNNPAAYANVRSLQEVIEDEYDDCLVDLYEKQDIPENHDTLLAQFKKHLQSVFYELLVVRNTGRFYVADEDKRIPEI